MKTRPFSFIHAADLHLGSAFQGIHQTAPEIATALREATYHAFNSMLDYAIQQEVDFVVIAGDIYNRNENSLQPQLRFRDGLQRLHDAGIRCCVIHGNHDPYDGSTDGLKWPEGCHRFPATVSAPLVIQKDGEDIAAVVGISYGRRDVLENLSRQYSHAHRHLFTLALLHTNCGSNGEHAAYAPSSVEELKTMDFDYWALGHIHGHAQLHPGQPAIVYAGSPQGLNPKETGEHGFCHVRVDTDHRVEVEFVPAGPVVWEHEYFDAALWSSEDDAVSALESLLPELSARYAGRSVLVRISIGGRTALHSWLSEAENQQDLLARLRSQSSVEPFVWVDRIRVETRPEIDLELRAQAEDILGEVLRQAKDATASEDGSNQALAELNDLFKHNRAKVFVSSPDPEQLNALIDRAALLVADHLVDEEAAS